MLRSRRSGFPGWVTSGAAALALHAGLAWALGSGLSGGLRAESAALRPCTLEPALVWVNAAVEESPAPGPAAESSPPLAPAAPPRRVSRSLPRQRAAAPLALREPRGDAPSDAVADGLTGALSSAPSPGAGSAAGGGTGPGGPMGLGLMGLGLTGLRAAGGDGASHAIVPAHLIVAGDPCADLFPYAARSDSGTVAVALDVATDGQPREHHVVDEAPRGQGFALAAHHCVQRLRFAPARDAEGHAVASRSVVRLRFARRAPGRAVAL